MRSTVFVVAIAIAVGTASAKAQDAQDKQVAVTVSPSTIASGQWVTVKFTGVPLKELNRPSTEFICTQDSYCKYVTKMSLWVGVFAEGANRTAIGPQTWGCANPPWLATSPIKWKPINTTSGQVQFHMEAAREARLEFVVFSNGTTYPIELAVSNPLTFTDVGSPKHVHLARTQLSSEMRVVWSAKDVDTNSRVQWGTSSGVYDSFAAAEPSTYSKNDLCGPPATTHGWWPAPWFYSAVMASLSPLTTYYYRVGSESLGWTPETAFVSPGAVGADESLHFIALADMGESYIDGAQYHWMEPFAINTTNFAIMNWGAEGTIPLALNPSGPGKTVSGKEAPPRGHVMMSLAGSVQKNDGVAHTDLVLHIGDLAYATGYETEWDRFMTQIEPIASRAAYMIMQGNHERDYPNSGSEIGGADSGGECGIPTQARFPMPTPSHRQDDGWYSFNQGPVHFVMMDTEKGAYNGSDQYAFFLSDLQAVNRSETPWVVFSGHRPMYSGACADSKCESGIGNGGYDIRDMPWAKDVETLLFQYQVDLCLWGHVHNAEVTCPLYRGKCVEPKTSGGYDAPVHAVIGNGGQSLSSFPVIPEPWSRWRYKEFGFSTVTVEGRTALTMKFFSDCELVGTRADCSASNKLVYNFTINRSPTLY
eukprot:m.58676 g.58676  ORF g.58676 m.58676 type:complete len:648 (+) comp22596_c0_seq2:141-2084(+)